jgi:hypothetical protein
MSLYGLQKLIRDVNRLPPVRDTYFAGSAELFSRYDLTEPEIAAVKAKDWGQLYRMGVHGLLLRPFSILHQLPEPDYLRAIREPA